MTYPIFLWFFEVQVLDLQEVLHALVSLPAQYEALVTLPYFCILVSILSPLWGHELQEPGHCPFYSSHA